MTSRKAVLIVVFVAMAGVFVYGYVLIRHGFSAAAQPSQLEKLVARAVRNVSIPSSAANEKNPLQASPENLEDGRTRFLARCSVCHGSDGQGHSNIGANLYPKPPDLSGKETQNLKDGEIHYIIKNGVRLTGMPAWGNPHAEEEDESWKLVLFIRSLGHLTKSEETQQAQAISSGHYVG